MEFIIKNFGTMKPAKPSGFPSSWEENSGVFAVRRYSDLKKNLQERIANGEGTQIINFTVTASDGKKTAHTVMSDQLVAFFEDSGIKPISVDNDNAKYNLDAKGLICEVGPNTLTFMNDQMEVMAPKVSENAIPKSQVLQPA